MSTKTVESPSVNCMKILMLLPHIGAGGDWTAIRLMAGGLRSKGCELAVCSESVSESQKGEFFDSAFNATMNKGIWELLKSFLKSRSNFPENFNVLHAHSPNCLLFAWLLKKFRCKNARLILTYHWQTDDTFFTTIFKKVLFKAAHKIHIYSVGTRDYLVQHYKVSSSKIHVVHLPVDPRRFPPPQPQEKSEAKSYFGLPSDSQVLLFAGRLNPEKNVGVILDFMNSHAETFSNVHLLIAGDGPMQDELKIKAETGTAMKRIHFLGRQQDIRKVYCAADLLLLPSTRMETFGLVCTEAGLMEVPTLRSDTPGAEDQITSGTNGWIYPKELDSAFADQLSHILRDPTLLAPAGRKAREVFLHKFDPEKCNADLHQLLST